MKAKNILYQKNNSKTAKFSLFVVLFSIFITAVVSGQTTLRDRNKLLKVKDSSLFKSKNPVAKANKIADIDTIKKLNPFDANQSFPVDSLFIPKGTYKLFKKNAHASYYHDKFHGRKTASGKKYDKNKYTAAHKKLPFGTMVKVTNEANGKSVIIEVTDRGPFVRAREIDLSRKAFMEITASKGAGGMKVTLEILQK